MNHNPYSLKVGDKAILDAHSSVEQTVTIVAFTRQELFARVVNTKLSEQQVNPLTVWEVMTNRLNPIYE